MCIPTQHISLLLRYVLLAYCKKIYQITESICGNIQLLHYKTGSGWLETSQLNRGMEGRVKITIVFFTEFIIIILKILHSF